MMSERLRPSTKEIGAWWAAALGFWLFVIAICVVQVAWMSRTPGQQVDVRGALTWQIAYFAAWIPLTVLVWRVTRGWLPDRFGGWARYLMAHIPVLAVVAILHALLVALLMVPFGPMQHEPLFARFLTQLRQEVTALPLIYAAIGGTGAAMTLSDRYRDRQVAAARLEAELAAARLEAQLVIRDGGRTIVIPFDDIVWIEAEDYCARLHLRNRTVLVRDSLRALADSLNRVGFVRVHRSAIANVACIRELVPLASGDQRLTLVDGTMLKVSRTHRAGVVKALEYQSAP